MAFLIEKAGSQIRIEPSGLAPVQFAKCQNFKTEVLKDFLHYLCLRPGLLASDDAGTNYCMSNKLVAF